MKHYFSRTIFHERFRPSRLVGHAYAVFDLASSTPAAEQKRAFFTARITFSFSYLPAVALLAFPSLNLHLFSNCPLPSLCGFFQINILLNFSAGEDCPCPEDIQDELNSFHDELRLHCGKRLRLPRCSLGHIAFVTILFTVALQDFFFFFTPRSDFVFLTLRPNAISLSKLANCSSGSPLAESQDPHFFLITQIYSTALKSIPEK